MANHHHQHEKRIDHFSHKHPLSLIEDEKVEMSKSDEYSKKNRSFLRCYGCTEKIGSGVPYYRCEEHCPSFCLHHSCAHLPTTIRRSHAAFCDRQDLQLMKRPNENFEKCVVCRKEWYRFAYVCSDCGRGVDIRCARKGPNEAKHSFHQHPVQPLSYSRRKEDNPVCSVCSLIIQPTYGAYYYYRCNYCNFIVHPRCTNVPSIFKSHSHHPQHKLYLDFDYPGSKICKICQEEIDRNTQWAYYCYKCDDDGGEYFVHAGYEGCLTSTTRKGDLHHFDHEHPLALAAEEAPPTLDHSIAQDCRCCRQKISLYVPHYTCIHCNKYRLHKLCALLPTKIKHPLHPNCTLKLLSGLDVVCSECDQDINGFAYHCSPCDFHLDVECAIRTQKVKTIFHKHPLFLSFIKGPFSCHACDRDNEGSSYQCTSCKFWLHEQCASLPPVKDNSYHEHRHELHLVHNIPEKYSRVVVYCRICTKALRHQRWAYHCNQCRYLTHVYDCSNPRREGGVTINASDVFDLPLDGEPILKDILTDGKIIKHHRHPMILFADQFKSNNVAIKASFTNLIRGSSKWPTFCVDGKDYSGITFSFYNSRLTMQVTGVELPRYIKHEDHPHVLESTFLDSSTWCHACEQSFFGRGFKCTTCSFTIDTYCALLPRIIKHRYDKHGFFSLTYSAIEGVEEYVCEICEEDVTPRYFYHCVDCDQSIHARCIWKAYVHFDPYYKFDLGCRSFILVPPSEELPKCIICEQKETYGHGFAFLGRYDRKYMVHLTCISEDDFETCS